MSLLSLDNGCFSMTDVALEALRERKADMIEFIQQRNGRAYSRLRPLVSYGDERLKDRDVEE
jgi:hypothetical protein